MKCAIKLGKCAPRLTSALFLAVFVPTLSASQLILNGGFETGDFTNWVVSNSSANGTFSVTKQASTPLTGNPTVAPASGTYYAVSDQFGPGSYAITQTFTVPLNTANALLTFAVFVNDQDDLGGSFGQVDLLAANADPLTGVPLAIFYGPADTFVANGQPNPYINVSTNITANLTSGVTYQLRALDRDTNPLDVGVDNFSIVTTTATSIPEPALFFPVVLAAGFLALLKRRL